MKENKKWDFLNDIWKKLDCRTEQIQKNWSYWNGDLKSSVGTEINQIIPQFKDTKTAVNFIKPIVETKLKAILDAEITLEVLPKIKTFSNLQGIQDAQDIADILTEELKNILKDNNIDIIQEKIVRDDHISSAGFVQILWDNEENILGRVKINHIPSDQIHYDKNAHGMEDSSAIGYQVKLSSAQVKEKYAKDEDGNFDLEKCYEIDSIMDGKNASEKDFIMTPENNQYGPASTFTNKDNSKISGVSRVAYRDKDNSYYQSKAKILTLNVLFFLDDSLYAPNKDDIEIEKEQKLIFQQMYPYGRMVVFSPDENKKVIFEDKALDESFFNLGNIDIFHTVNLNKIFCSSLVDDLKPNQNRMNGLYIQALYAIKNNINSIVIEKDKKSSQDNFVAQPVIFIDYLGEKGIQTVTNNGIGVAKELLDMLNFYKSISYEQSRINETMLFGQRQEGTTSAEQVKALEESPLADTRQSQNSLKNFMIKIGDKSVKLIKNNYKFGRLISLSTNIGEGKFARVEQSPMNMQEQQSEQQQDKVLTIELLNENFEVIKKLKWQDDWEFKVEVVAGTRIPRSKRDNGLLLQSLLEKGILGPPDNILLLEEFLRTQDLPNYRTIIQLIKQQQQAQQAAAQQPGDFSIGNLLKNPVTLEPISDFLKSLDGHSKAKGDLLKILGLNPDTDTLEDAPVQEITQKSDVGEVAIVAPSTISDNPQRQQEGYERSVILKEDTTKK